MSILVIQILNSLFYASALFLIAAGLSLIFGVMRIVNMAHGTLYAVGAYVTAWLIGRATAAGVPLPALFLLLPVAALAVALIGLVIEPLLLRPLYRRAEEYQLLVTFGLLLILAFVVVVIGGLGSLQGALIGALVVSFVRTAGIQFFPEVELAILYLIAALVLLIKPTGLFGSA